MAELEPTYYYLVLSTVILMPNGPFVCVAHINKIKLWSVARSGLSIRR